MFSRDLGIDLGCATTLVYVRGKGIVISEPSVVAIDTRTRRTFGVGTEAKATVGKTPESIVAVRPLKDGVIADFNTVEMMLHYFTSSARFSLDDLVRFAKKWSTGVSARVKRISTSRG